MRCTVCEAENDRFATVCIRCGGFLQNRISNLDLFDTVWRVLENPNAAFRMIAISEHKNYSIFLYSLFGVCMALTDFWFFRAGERFESMLTLLGWSVAIGVPLGLVLCPTVSCIHWLVTFLLGGRSGFRNSVGMTSYALTPIILSRVLIFPIELLTFGMYLFTWNPSPMTLKPALFLAFLSIDALLTLWSLILMISGTRISAQVNAGKSIVAAIAVFGVIGTVLTAGGGQLLKFL